MPVSRPARASPAAIEPSSAARAPDWSRHAAACEAAAVATCPRSQARVSGAAGRALAGALDDGELPGAAARRRVSCSSACAASSATSAAERRVGRTGGDEGGHQRLLHRDLRGELVGLLAR